MRGGEKKRETGREIDKKEKGKYGPTALPLTLHFIVLQTSGWNIRFILNKCRLEKVICGI